MGSGGHARRVGENPYRLHEFGTLDPAHDFRFWPGFSLNPGVWDVAYLRATFEMAGEALEFDAGDERFEQSFSKRCEEIGILHMAYLPALSFSHIGDMSAYKANEQQRPF